MSREPITESDVSTWHNAGDVAQQALATIANKSKDKADEALDAQRTHGGETLEQFLAGKK